MDFSSKSVFSNIVKACRGISGLDQASGPGDRSSVLISPSTFRTMAVMCSGIAGLFKNHSASAHEEITFLARSLVFDNSNTSWKESKINKVLVIGPFGSANPNNYLKNGAAVLKGEPENFFHKINLTKFLENFKKLPQELISFEVNNPHKIIMNADVRSEVSKIEKKLGYKGRVLIRPSGTEDLLRVMVEASTKELAEGLAKEISDFIRRAV